MVDYQYKQRFTDYLGRIISIAVKRKIVFQVITQKLSDSDLLKEIENGDYFLILNYTPEELFSKIFDMDPVVETSYFKYDDAYWCGYIYANIFYRYDKNFPYIFLILPLEELLDMYPLYHEMDISSLFNYYDELEKKETLLSRLLKYRQIKATKLSILTGISFETIKYYKKNNQNIYNANFNTIKKIAIVLNIDDRIFLENNFHIENQR